MTDHTLILWQYDWTQKGRSTNSLKAMTANLMQFQAWLGAPLDTATLPQILAFLTERGALSAYRAHNSWRALRSYYTYLAELDGSPSVVAKLRVPKLPEPPTKGVDAGELKRFLATCTKGSEMGDRDRAILLVLQSTGLRVGEISRLTLDNLNIEQRCLLVAKSKTGKPRVVPMSQDATVAVVKWLRVRARCKTAHLPNLWLSRRFEPLTLGGIHQMFRDRNTAAGTHVTAHQFRRSFAVNWLSNGGSQTSLQALCGWANGQMVTRYVRHSAGELAATEYRRMFG